MATLLRSIIQSLLTSGFRTCGEPYNVWAARIKCVFFITTIDSVDTCRRNDQLFGFET
jgi:hypothetical protein